VHEQEVQRHVEQVRDDGDDERRPQVEDPAQRAGRGEHQQHGGHRGCGDEEVGRRVALHLRGAAEHPGQGTARGGEQTAEHHAEPDREPQSPGGTVERGPFAAGAVQSRDRRGAAVGQEHAQSDDREQDARRDGQTAQLGHAEPADDRGVGEQHQGLADEGEEGRDGDRDDLAVGRAPGEQVSVPGCGFHRNFTTAVAVSIRPGGGRRMTST
jgi:hypothetical protein